MTSLLVLTASKFDTHEVFSITAVCFDFSQVTIFGLKVARVKKRNDVFLADVPQKNKCSSVNMHDTDLVHMSKDCHFNLPYFDI